MEVREGGAKEGERKPNRLRSRPPRRRDAEGIYAAQLQPPASGQMLMRLLLRLPRHWPKRIWCHLVQPFPLARRNLLFPLLLAPFSPPPLFFSLRSLRWADERPFFRGRITCSSVGAVHTPSVSRLLANGSVGKLQWEE